jgi:hypothetical protein
MLKVLQPSDKFRVLLKYVPHEVRKCTLTFLILPKAKSVVVYMYLFPTLSHSSNAEMGDETED